MRAGLTVVAAAVLMVSPAQACHRFRVWNFPYPQRCVVAHVQAAQPDRSWFDEIQDTAPPAVVSGRTPEQEADQREHDEAVRSHKDELNDLMKILKLNERIAGFQGVDDK